MDSSIDKKNATESYGEVGNDLGKEPNVAALLVEGNKPPREVGKTALPNDEEPYGALVNEQAFGDWKNTEQVFGTPDGAPASASAIAAAESQNSGSGSKLGKVQEKLGHIVGSDTLVEKGIAKQNQD